MKLRRFFLEFNFLSILHIPSANITRRRAQWEWLFATAHHKLKGLSQSQRHRCRLCLCFHQIGRCIRGCLALVWTCPSISYLAKQTEHTYNGMVYVRYLQLCSISSSMTFRRCIMVRQVLRQNSRPTKTIKICGLRWPVQPHQHTTTIATMNKINTRKYCVFS